MDHMCLKIILRVTKNQSFILSLEETFSENPQEGSNRIKTIVKSFDISLIDIIKIISVAKLNKWNYPIWNTQNMLVCDHKVVHEDFKFLGNEFNRYLLELKESFFIKRDKPSLNKNLYSQELILFWVFHIG